MTTLINTLVFEHTVVEIHFNDLLKIKPYLVRVFSYNNNPVEIRYSKEEIDNFLENIQDNYYL